MSLDKGVSLNGAPDKVGFDYAMLIHWEKSFFLLSYNSREVSDCNRRLVVVFWLKKRKDSSCTGREDRTYNLKLLHNTFWMICMCHQWCSSDPQWCTNDCVTSDADWCCAFLSLNDSSEFVLCHFVSPLSAINMFPVFSKNNGISYMFELLLQAAHITIVVNLSVVSGAAKMKVLGSNPILSL